MLRKTVKLFILGIAYGCTVSSIICLIGVMINGDEWLMGTPRGYAAQIIASIIVGVSWTLPCVVYQIEKLSRAQQVIIHMTIGFIVYIPCAFYMEWIPTTGGIVAIIADIIFVFVVSLIIWFCFSLYYKKEAEIMNRKIKDLTKKH